MGGSNCGDITIVKFVLACINTSSDGSPSPKAAIPAYLTSIGYSGEHHRPPAISTAASTAASWACSTPGEIPSLTLRPSTATVQANCLALRCSIVRVRFERRPLEAERFWHRLNMLRGSMLGGQNVEEGDARTSGRLWFQLVARIS